jgi:hypothetical protein
MSGAVGRPTQPLPLTVSEDVAVKLIPYAHIAKISCTAIVSQRPGILDLDDSFSLLEGLCIDLCAWRVACIVYRASAYFQGYYTLLYKSTRSTVTIAGCLSSRLMCRVRMPQM